MLLKLCAACLVLVRLAAGFELDNLEVFRSRSVIRRVATTMVDDIPATTVGKIRPASMVQTPFQEDYKLSDLIRRNCILPGDYKQLQSQWPDSIAAEYLLMVKADEKTDVSGRAGWCAHHPGRNLTTPSAISNAINFTVLDGVLTKRVANYPRPSELKLLSAGTVVVHLRLGDCLVMNGKLGSWDNESSGYGRRFYSSVIAALPKAISRVVIVGSTMHDITGSREKSWRVSLEYREKVVKLFESAGLSVVQRWNGDPDEDFTFMSQARLYVRGQGGYSHLAAQMVKRFGGTVWGPMNWCHSSLLAHDVHLGDVTEQSSSLGPT